MGSAEPFTHFGVEGGIERERAMTEVLKTVPLGPSGRQRQDRVQTIQLCLRHARAIIMCETLNCSASLRVLRWVEPSGGSRFTVHSRIRASSVGVGVLGS